MQSKIQEYYTLKGVQVSPDEALTVLTIHADKLLEMALSGGFYDIEGKDDIAILLADCLLAILLISQNVETDVADVMLRNMSKRTQGQLFIPDWNDLGGIDAAHCRDYLNDPKLNSTHHKPHSWNVLGDK